MATTDQGAYAAVYRPSLCGCMQTKEHMQLYAGQGAYAASDFELHESRDANVFCAYLL